MYVTEIRVRYGETDAMGVVYHANYLVYFELGRTEFVRALGYPYARLEGAGIRLAVVEAGLRIRRPARYDDLLEVVTALRELTAVRMRFDYRVRRKPDAAGIAEGHTVLASIGEDGRVRRLPPEVLAVLEPALERESDGREDAGH